MELKIGWKPLNWWWAESEEKKVGRKLKSTGLIVLVLAFRQRRYCYPCNPSVSVYALALLPASSVPELIENVCCFERISFAREPNVATMIDKNDNKRLRDATLAKVTKEMDLPRLSASVERGTTKKLPSQLSTFGGKIKKRILPESSESFVATIRPTPLIHVKPKRGRKKSAN